MTKGGQKASLKISQDVIEKIAKVAALEVNGVAGVTLPNTNIKKKFANAITQKSVDTKINNGVAEITIGLILDFDAKILNTCKNVQKKVKDNVQNMTNIVVSKVNIYIEGVDFIKKDDIQETSN